MIFLADLVDKMPELKYNNLLLKSHLEECVNINFKKGGIDQKSKAELRDELSLDHWKDKVT